jgi:HAD superfamily hydrolase (TIGR01509 family)
VNKEFFATDRYKALLFDFDGTLLDSFSAHLDVFRIMFARFGITIEKQQFLDSYSPNWYKTYEGMGLPQKDWKAADRIWLQEVEHQEPHLFPGVSDTLRRLNENCDIGLVTSGSKTRVVKDLERTGITSLFKVIVTGDDIQLPKPSPDGLEVALQKLDIQPEETAYIGDANADYEMSLAGGVNFIGVRSDYDRFKNSNQFICMESVNELPELLRI